MEPIVTVRQLSKSYGKKLALDSTFLEIPQGKIIGLLGPNGSGKSTIIKIINGLLTPDTGEVLVKGNEVGIESKKHISYLPERTYLDPNVKVSYMIKFFSDFYEDFLVEKASNLITSFGIDLNSKVKSLSKGMKEKVQLSLVMSRDVELYILDEPIAGVDPASREFILDTVIKTLPKGASLIICTHLIYEIEEILDEVIVLNNGRVVLMEETKKVKEEFGSVDQWFRKEFRYV